MMRRLITIFLCASLAAGSAFAWNPAGDRIKTRWAAEVSPENAHPEYPRPQMVRADWMNLNGLWNYAITDIDADAFTGVGQILVPFCVESSLSGVGRTVSRSDALWYERSFMVPRSWRDKDKRVILHFGAVDWKAEVWVNGTKVGEHTGGYTPFSFDITPYLKKNGPETVRLEVTDATDNSYQPRGKQVSNPRGIWYTAVTGIWQTVWLEPVAESHIESYGVAYNHEGGTLGVAAKVEGMKAGDQIMVELLDGGVGYNPETPSADVLFREVTERRFVSFTLDNPRMWSPDDPYLYGLKISLLRKGKVIDCVNGYTSVRTIEVRRDQDQDRNRNHYRRMALNGSNLFQFGPLDQGWWPDGLYTAPTDAALRFDIERTKAWGFNMIRKHIKVEPARWYYWCDVFGMMVWQDMPCIADHDKNVARDERVKKNSANTWAMDSYIGGTDADIPREWKENYYKEWGEIMASLRNFQCIVMWVPFNEAWGQFDTEEVVKFTRERDDSRLVNEASGGNFHFCGDVLDVHHYPCPAMNAFESKFCNVLGEYGGIGFPVEGHLWSPDGNWGYFKQKTSGKEVLDQYEDFAEMLKVFIGTGCSAAVYTQTTDVEIEVNGLMTYDRFVKIDEERLREINRSVIASMEE